MGGDAQKTAIEAVDVELGRIFDLIENEAELVGKTVLILTSDHGGGGGWTHGHTMPTHKDNYTIPFYVWGQGVSSGDLYALIPIPVLFLKQHLTRLSQQKLHPCRSAMVPLRILRFSC